MVGPSLYREFWRSESENWDYTEVATPQKSWVGDRVTAVICNFFAPCCVQLTVAATLNDVETSAKSRCFRSGGIVRRVASDGMCGAE